MSRQDDPPTPHDGVYVRIGRSAIHGVGVIAILPIPEGTNLFPWDNEPLAWVRRTEVEALPQALRQLYADFGVRRGEAIGVPPSLCRLTPGWHLNEPAPGETANVRVNEDLQFHAARDIAVGEELTVEYRRFSD